MFELYVERKNVYGVDRFYPVCEKAKILCNISGNKTLVPGVIDCIKALGYKLEQPREEI